MRMFLACLAASLLVAVLAHSAPVMLSYYTDDFRAYTNSDTLDADSTYSDTLLLRGAETLTCQLEVLALGDSLHLSLLGSNDGVNWQNVDEDGATTVTATGNYALVFVEAESFFYYTFLLRTYGAGTVTVLPHFRPGRAFVAGD